MNIFQARREILKNLIADRTITAFCREHDLKAPFISQILNKRRDMGDRAAKNLEEKINLPQGTLTMPSILYDVLEPAPAISKWNSVNIVGTAQMGDHGYWCELEATEGSIDVITTDPDAYALRVKGDSMAPAIRNGWIVWCEPNKTPVNGEYVMVQTADGRSMVKELLYCNSIEASLMSVNTAYDRINLPIAEIERIHYVGGIVPPSKVKL